MISELKGKYLINNQFENGEELDKKDRLYKILGGKYNCGCLSIKHLSEFSYLNKSEKYKNWFIEFVEKNFVLPSIKWLY